MIKEKIMAFYKAMMKKKVLSSYKAIAASASNMVEMEKEETLDEVMREDGVLLIAGMSLRYEDIKAYRMTVEKEHWNHVDYPQDEETWYETVEEVGIKGFCVGNAFSSRNGESPELWIYTDSATIHVPSRTMNSQREIVGMGWKDVNKLKEVIRNKILNCKNI